jgi:cytochrome c biogenesis protein CcmG, thiol:disulfide interchange protein DsbE
VRTGPVIAVVAVAAALVALLAYGVASQGQDTSIDEAVERGDRPSAPEATLPVLGADGSGSLRDYRGQVVVLNFWASWCPPCVDELPLLERTQRRIKRQGATVLGVNYQDLPEDANVFVDRFGLSFPNLRDRDGEYAEKYAILGFPETFVIDREGRIAAARRGPVTAGWLETALSPLLRDNA